MAGKGGGAWKVAYADFVTAMMAFFMVMWLTAQNQEVKEAVANYFSDPLGFMEEGTQTKASRRDSATEAIIPGSKSIKQKVAMGQGRRSYSQARGFSPATKLVSDSLLLDDASREYWIKQAREQQEEARWSPEVREKRTSEKHLAIERLGRQLKEEFLKSLPSKTDGVYRELVADALKDVNWQEIAEDLIGP